MHRPAIAVLLEGEHVLALDHVEQLAVGVPMQRRAEARLRRRLEAEERSVALGASHLVRDEIATSDEHGPALVSMPHDHSLAHCSLLALRFFALRSSMSVRIAQPIASPTSSPDRPASSRRVVYASRLCR